MSFNNDIDNNSTIQSYLIQLNYYIIGLGGLLMFCIGIITNILNLIVFSRRAMKTTTNKYLSALAICDIFVLIFSQLTTSNSFINDYNETTDSFEEQYGNSILYYSSLPTNESLSTTTVRTTRDFTITTPIFKSDKSYLSKLYFSWSLNAYPRIYPFAYPIAILFQISTVWINVGMSVDRFVAIHFPLKSLKYCTISNAKRIIKIIFLLAVLYSLPRFFEYHTVVDKIKLNNNNTIDIVFFQHTQIGKSNVFKIIVYFWMYLLFQSIVPLILLTMLNFSLVYSVKTSGKFVNRFNANCTTKLSKSSRTLKVIFNKEKTRKETTVMLISVVILFVLLQTPSVVCNFLHSLNTDRSTVSFNINAICYVGNFLIITNSATNFFSYCLFHRRFRQEFTMCILRIFCRSLFIAYKKRKRLSVSISYNNFVYNLRKYEKKGASVSSFNQKTNAIYYNNNQVKLVYLNEFNGPKENQILNEGNEVEFKCEIENYISNENSHDDNDENRMEKDDSDINVYNIIYNNELTESNVAYV